MATLIGFVPKRASPPKVGAVRRPPFVMLMPMKPASIAFFAQ